MTSKKKKLFWAVNLSVASTRRIADAVARLRQAAQTRGLRVAWIPPANLHVTLKYLGWATAETVDAIADRVVALTAARKGFDLTARGTGAFPSPGAARILWVGVQDPSGGLAQLAGEVDAAMAALGFPAEERAFHPHVTVGRVREGRGAGEVLASLGSATDFGTSFVREIVLYENITRSKGSEYIALRRLPLDVPPPRTERQTRGVEEEASEEEPGTHGGQ